MYAAFLNTELTPVVLAADDVQLVVPRFFAVHEPGLGAKILLPGSLEARVSLPSIPVIPPGLAAAAARFPEEMGRPGTIPPARPPVIRNYCAAAKAVIWVTGPWAALAI